jgi:hypothetical protein
MMGLLAAFGLAAATGLNAYLPLLIVGLLARYTQLIALKAPWNALTHPVVLVVVAVLLVIEVTVDKIPAVAGAILFAAPAPGLDMGFPGG